MTVMSNDKKWLGTDKIPLTNRRRLEVAMRLYFLITIGKKTYFECVPTIQNRPDKPITDFNKIWHFAFVFYGEEEEEVQVNMFSGHLHPPCLIGRISKGQKKRQDTLLVHELRGYQSFFSNPDVEDRYTKWLHEHLKTWGAE